MKLLALLSTLLVACAGMAQIGGPPTPPPIQSLELFTAESPVIATATLVEFASDGLDANPHPAKVKVREMIKGARVDTLSINIHTSTRNLEHWRATGALLLVAVPEGASGTPHPGSGVYFSTLVSTVINLSDPALAVITKDLHLLRDPDQVIAAVQKQVPVAKPSKPPGYYARRVSVTTIKGTSLEDYPPSWRPYEPGLEWLAVFVPIDAALERYGLDQLNAPDSASRVDGIRALANFKSPGNIRRLKQMLRDPLYHVYANPELALLSEQRVYDVRAAALQVLSQQWQVPDCGDVVTSEFVSLLSTVEELKPNRELTNTELTCLQHAPKLRALELWHGSDVSPIQTSMIGSLTGLESLTLRDCRLMDWAVAPLGHLRNLRTLELDNNPLSDDAIAVIASLPKLTELSVLGTHMTSTGLEKLKQKLPGLRITSNFDGFVALTNARCRRPVYSLKSDHANLWSTVKLGHLTGPITWSTSPSGRAYFGPFGQQALTLHLRNLPAHQHLEVDIELWVIGSWDGDGSLGAGPDIMDISAPGVGLFLHSTFFNNNEGGAANLALQSFPDPFPGGRHLGYTGAAEVRTLGFTEPWDGQINHRDAVYQLHYNFAHTASSFELRLAGLTVPQAGINRLEDDEHWGLGAVTVKRD